mgnify:CR=1 FL=1
MTNAAFFVAAESSDSQCDRTGVVAAGDHARYANACHLLRLLQKQGKPFEHLQKAVCWATLQLLHALDSDLFSSPGMLLAGNRTEPEIAVAGLISRISRMPVMTDVVPLHALSGGAVKPLGSSSSLVVDSVPELVAELLAASCVQLRSVPIWG